MRLEPFKFPGCKASLAPQIRALFPASCTGTYYEPFLGSGAVFHALEPERAHLSDLDPWVAHIHAAIRDEPTRVNARLDQHRAATWTRKRHLAMRAWVNRVDVAPTRAEAPEWAADLITLIAASHNGVYRRNAAGGFNVGWNQRPNPSIPDADRIRAASERYRGAVFAVEDFSTVLARCGRGDWAYLDPPYVGAGTWNGYGGCSFDDLDLERLVLDAEAAADRGAIVVLSHLEGLALGPRWKVEQVDVVQRIAPTAKDRGVRREILAVVGA